MPNNPPHNALRRAVSTAIANGSPIVENIPVARWYVLATVAKTPTHDYPFAVVAVDSNGVHCQEILCRSRRDCLLVGNGIATGLMFAKVSCEANTRFDPRAFGEEG